MLMKLDLPVTLSSLASCVHGDTGWGGHGLVLPSSEKRREKRKGQEAPEQTRTRKRNTKRNAKSNRKEKNNVRKTIYRLYRG